MSGFGAVLAEARRASARLDNRLAPCLYASRKAKVFQAYHEAKRAATTPQQRSEAQLFLCSAYLIFAEQNGITEADSLASVQQAFGLLVTAAGHAPTGAAQSAYDACTASANDLLSDPDLDLDGALSFWARVVPSADQQRSWRGRLSMDQARWIYAYGRRCMATSPDFKTGLRCGHEAEGPVEVAMQSARQTGDTRLVKKAEELSAAIQTFIRCTCESTQARAQADRQLASFSQQPHADEIWQVVDKYTQALRQTEEQDLLSECRAHARLGHVFDKYLKLRSKAVQNCKRAVQLAHHIKPHPVGHDWYMDCQNTLVRIQREQQSEEQARQDSDEAAVLKELEPQLRKVRAAKARGARDLLVYIKQHHPARFNSKLPEPAYDDIRKSLRKAVVEYSPDKQLKYDQKWQVLAREICKEVNDVYSGYCS